MTTETSAIADTKSCFALNLPAYENLREVVKKDPAQAQFTFKTTTEWLGGARARTQARNFSIVTDEPHPLGGTDSAPDPVELLLTAASTCLQIGIVTQAAKRNIEIHNLSVEAEGDLDVRGYLGVEEVRPGYQQIRYKVNIKSDAPREVIEEIVRLVQRTSPMVDNITNGTPVNAEVVIE